MLWRLPFGRAVLGTAAILVANVGTLAQRPIQLSGVVYGATGNVIQGAIVRAGQLTATTDESGRYSLTVPSGPGLIEVLLNGSSALTTTLDFEQDRTLDFTLAAGANLTVHATADALFPDPATQAYAHSELLDANPGRPGAPVSIPGHPIETASGGIKAPQYFAPGVAGDHGEPVAQFLQIGGLLFQNNLTANAHGNGYADPNLVIGTTIGDVLVDNGAFNARYGDHAINLAVTYGIRDRLPTQLQASTDGRDAALTASWGATHTQGSAWVAAEALAGNGFLARPEERQQYKINALRTWDLRQHTLTAYGVAYYGFSRVPGLIPIDTPVMQDTIDPRQADLTHTTVALISDEWNVSGARKLVTGVYFQTYSLALRSNFGDGLIRQSEFRTVQGGSSTYTQRLGNRTQLLAGLEGRRDAPRGLDLAHLGPDGLFHLVTSNDLTINEISPFAALSGSPLRHVQLYAGVRHDQLLFSNRDLLIPANSFQASVGQTSPKLTATLGERTGLLPQVSFSFAKAFHANDPRIGSGTGQGSLLIQSREFQIFASKRLLAVDWQLTVSKVSSSGELAKIDPDTGLQENLGPSSNRFLTVQGRRRFERGTLQISWSEADARDRTDGSPIPEAPRAIVDAVGTWNSLPLGVQAKAEYEYIKAKPLGDGFSGLPVQEIRLALHRAFADDRWRLSCEGQLNRGYTGQTTEFLQLGTETSATERPVGVPLRSFASISLQYRLSH